MAVPVLTAEGDGDYDPVAALDRAERAGLLYVEADRVEFTDPMMGEVVCRRATSAELTRAHLEMARLLDGRGPATGCCGIAPQPPGAPTRNWDTRSPRRSRRASRPDRPGGVDPAGAGR